MYCLALTAVLVAFAHAASASSGRLATSGQPGWQFSMMHSLQPPGKTWSSRPMYTPSTSIFRQGSSSVTQPASTTASGMSISTSGSFSGSVNFTSSAPVNTACAEVSKSVDGKFSFSSGLLVPTNFPTVAADLAYECLNSVPFNVSNAVAQMDSIRPYLDWQTTLSYVADPPAEYAAKVQPPYDFYAEFERLYEEAQAAGFASEYQFSFELYRAFQRVHDGHFAYFVDLATGLFTYGGRPALVSVSEDGESIPEIYVYSDILGAVSASYEPSPVVSIDGQDAAEYLLEFSQNGSLQDPDALWNGVFYNLAQVSLGPYGGGPGSFAGGSYGRFIYPGPSTTLEFANGTNVTNSNYAQVQIPFDGVQSGTDLYQTFLIAPIEDPTDAQELVSSSSSSPPLSSLAPSSSFSSSIAATTTVPAPGYPSPFVRESQNLNANLILVRLLLEGEGYDDIAVLSVASFLGFQSLQSVNAFLISEAVDRGKKKLIIDLSANGGGVILQAYDLFKQLFPDKLPYGANRFRVHEAFDLIGYEVSWYAGQFPRDPDETNITAASIASLALNYRTDRDVDYKPFTSWDDKNGPRFQGPGLDAYTDLLRWNLDDPLNPISSGITVSGYGDRDNLTRQPFAAENIVIVTDGFCGSTCSIFSELMRQQAGIQTVVVGGRPTRDIAQAVGGVKGTNSIAGEAILYYVQKPFQIQHFNDGDYYDDNTALGDYTVLPFYRSLAFGVNGRDGIRQGDEEGVPLQFVYEPAECRLYYTPAMVVDQSEVWRVVADTAFNNVNQCVAGSLGKTDSRIKRSDRGRQHISRNVDLAAHYKTLAADHWIPASREVLGGDCVMIR